MLDTNFSRSSTLAGTMVRVDQILAVGGLDRRCVYEDGDCEDLTLNELKRLATLSSDIEVVRVDGGGVKEAATKGLSIPAAKEKAVSKSSNKKYKAKQKPNTDFFGRVDELKPYGVTFNVNDHHCRQLDAEQELGTPNSTNNPESDSVSYFYTKRKKSTATVTNIHDSVSSISRKRTKSTTTVINTHPSYSLDSCGRSDGTVSRGSSSEITITLAHRASSPAPASTSHTLSTGGA